MEQLLKNLENTINKSVREFIEAVVTKYQLTDEDIDPMFQLWLSTKPQKQSAKTVSVADSSRQVSDGTGCPYIYTKGTKKETVCNVKSKDGSVFCSTHKKYEGQDPKERKVLPEPKGGVKKTPPPKDTKRIFNMHNILKKLVHADTGMVINSAEDRTVIGKVTGNKLVELAEEDIEVCQQWGFKVKETKPEETQEEEENQEEEEVEEPVPTKKPVAKPVPSKPVATSVKPVTKPVAKPVVAAAKPVVKPVTKPVVAAAKPVVKPVVKPVAKPVVKPVVKPVAKTKSDDTEEALRDLDEENITEKLVTKALGVEDDEEAEEEVEEGEEEMEAEEEFIDE